jgi:hypothetical protein
MGQNCDAIPLTRVSGLIGCGHETYHHQYGFAEPIRVNGTRGRGTYHHTCHVEQSVMSALDGPKRRHKTRVRRVYVLTGSFEYDESTHVLGVYASHKRAEKYALVEGSLYDYTDITEHVLS